MNDVDHTEITTGEGGFAAIALQAVVDLHVVLQDWFNAVGNDDLELVLSHFDPDFRIVSPAGRTTALPQFAAILPGLRGSRPGLLMEISDAECRQSGPDWAVVSYVERQRQGDDETRRISTVLFRAASAAPRARWVHLQETWASPT